MKKNYKVLIVGALDENKEEMFIALDSNGRIELYKKELFSGSEYPKSVLDNLENYGLKMVDNEIIVTNSFLFLKNIEIKD